MSIRIVCPSCRSASRVSQDVLGKKIRCPECDEVIVASAGAEAARPRKSRPPEDEPPARRAPRRRRSRGELGPVTIVVATLVLLVVVAAVSVGAYFLSRRPPASRPDAPPQGQAADAGPGSEEPLMERQAQFEDYFRTPEEPPLDELEFTMPPPGDEPDPEEGKAPKSAPNATGLLAPEVLQKVKEATVYLRVRSAHGESEGSGFFAAEPGVVITNAHVVGMLARNAPEPKSVRVVRNKGEANESGFAARVLAVDPDADLALLSVPKEGMPEPLLVRSARHLRETQPVYVAGFPLGEVPGKNVTINKYELSSLKKEKGVLEKLQVHGDMLPGNSGGPVLDADGAVVGVCVSILRNTRINFAIPGDKVRLFLDGRLDELVLDPPASRGEGGLVVPAAVKVIDPLGRVRQVAVDCWVGEPGPSRPGGRTPPKPRPGDGPRQTLALDVHKQAGRGELALPPLPPGRVYWVQPSLVGRGGARAWLSARVYQAPAPVERKPARLALKPAGDWPLVLERWSRLEFTDPRGHDHRALVNLETRLTDTAKGREGSDLAVYRQFTGFKEGVAVDGDVQMTTRLRHIVPNIRFLADNLVVDAEGTTKRDDPDLKIKDVPPAAKRHLLVFQLQVQKFLKGLEVPLPGGEVQPGATWKARRPLPIDATWSLLDVLPPETWGPAESAFLDVTYTYMGVRPAGGAGQAVIRLAGQVTPESGGGLGSAARLSGTAVVDLATGQVVEEEVTTRANLELVMFNTVALRAQGTVLARLRRE